MDLNANLWRKHQYGVLVSFVHHIAYWRAFSTALDHAKLHSEMWIHTTDAHLLCAVINWCMVFGADSNEVHWKNVVLDEPAQDQFRQALLHTLAITRTEWDAYWSSMTTFRNDFATHRMPGSRYPTVPKMETALQAAIAYDDWFRQALSDLFDEPSLSDRYNRLMRTSADPLAKMIAVAPSVSDEYEGSPPKKP